MKNFFSFKFTIHSLKRYFNTITLHDYRILTKTTFKDFHEYSYWFTTLVSDVAPGLPLIAVCIITILKKRDH